MDHRSIQSNLRILQKKKGFVHHRALTNHLRANEQVGRFMQALNKTEQIANLQGKSGPNRDMDVKGYVNG